MTIGEKIALRRRTAGLSQEALAARLGVSRQAVSRWETGESLPDAEKIVQLCQILGVSADELLMKNAQPTLRGSQNTSVLAPSGRQWASLAAALLLRLGGLCVLATLLALFYSVWDFCQRLGHSVWYWLCNGLFGGWYGLLLAVGIGMMITGITIRVWLRKNGSVQPL